MRRVVPIVLAALATLGAAPPAPRPSAERIRADVTYLASDHLQGRAPGTVGHALAADHVRRQLEAAGVKPAGDGGGWYQVVPFRSASNAAAPAITLSVGGERVRLSGETDIGIDPSLTEQKRSVDAPLVFVGHGISDPRVGIDEYAGLDVRGKIVVALGGLPAGLPRDVSSHLQSTKRDVAAAKGAIGYAQLNFGTFNPARDYWRRSLTDWADTAGAGRNAVLRWNMTLSPETGRRLFRGAKLSMDEVGTRGATPVPGFALPGRLRIESQSKWQDFASPQVIGIIPGTDPAMRDDHVVVMAHLDHLGTKADARPGEDAIYNGALDNAAGVATMIEAARLFGASGAPPRRSILFVATTGEEGGLIGSDHLAARPLGRRIVAAVDLDMPLLTYDFTDVVAFGGDHSTIGRTAALAAGAMGVAVSPDPMPHEGLFVRSDHYRLVQRGIPAVFLMTGHANGGREAWSRYLTTVYHQPSDDVRQPIRWANGARFAELNYRIARALADSAERPGWLPEDYFGRLFGSAATPRQADARLDFAPPAP